MNPNDTTTGTLTPPRPEGTTIAQRVEHVRERAGEVTERLKERVRGKEEEYADLVRERPLRSLLVAAGVGAGLGLVLGVLLARR
jgi:ElaB/YqjD/DUF883 family membrane-anchored ribosome-binding protein